MPLPALSRRRKGLYALLVVSLVLGICEVGQRLSDWRKYARRDRRDGSRYSVVLSTASGQLLEDEPAAIAIVHHPLLAYKARPHRPRDGLTINAQGFRGRDWTLDKPPGAARVIVLGGSVAFGHGCTADDRTVAARLEGGLSRPDRPVEVWNAGVPGYDSAQELVLLVTEVLDYRPDVVVVLDGWNDFHHAGQSAPGQPILRSPFVAFDEAAALSRSPGRALLRASAFYRSLERNLGDWARRSRDRTAGGGFGAYADRPDGLADYERNLSRLVRIVRAEGARAVLASQPELYQRRGAVPAGEQKVRDRIESGDAPYARAGYRAYAEGRYPAYIDAARRAAESNDAGYVDAARIFDGLDEAVFTDFCHVDDRGHQLLAEALAPAIEARLAR
jgi:lysophospholipase L1-like esterase